MQFHRVERARDKNFWSVRVNRGVRMIVHKTAANLLLCYVGEHVDAYRWAERRPPEQHPHTGAAQLVEIREVVREVEIPRYVATERAMFAGVPDSQLSNYGVPDEWLDDVKRVADEDALLALANHLPAEAAEALLELATGSTPERPVPGATDGDPFPSGCSTPLSRHVQPGGTAPSVGVSMGQVDGLSTSRAAAGGGMELPRPGARPSWRCIARCILLGPTRTHACC